MNFENELNTLLQAGWRLNERESISKTFRFKDFQSAFAWMTKVAHIAEEQDHHPEWLNVYNRVSVTLTSHDVKHLTMRDIKLAQAMEQV